MPLQSSSYLFSATVAGSPQYAVFTVESPPEVHARKVAKDWSSYLKGHLGAPAVNVKWRPVVVPSLRVIKANIAELRRNAGRLLVQEAMLSWREAQKRR